MFYISLITFMMLFLYSYKKNLHMAQQNLYNDDNRFLKWTLRELKSFKDYTKCELVVILTLIIINLLKLNYSFIIGLYIFIVSFIIFLVMYKNDRKNITKLSFKVTSRVKRLIFTNTLLFLIFVLFAKGISNKNAIYLLLFIYNLLIPLVIILSIIINKPIEKLVYLSYKSKAVKKLDSMNNLKVIGITGSYGKTSSKNILNDILNIKYNSLASPKNFNTPYGLIITVNNYLDKFDDILIAEMGAYKVGEIEELCKLVKPKYGILTRIGKAHIEIFGSQENIIKGKFELIENLPEDGIGVLNGDDELQVNYNLKNNCKIIWIGIDNKDVDVYASSIKTSNVGTTFDVTFKGDSNKYRFTTKLLGYNNIYNILSSLALAKEFGLSIEQMQRAVIGVKPVEHRLEIRNAGNITYIDDSYNSNPVGSKMALDVLKNMEGQRIVMTPGMVELGCESYELNKEFGMHMKNTCDIVILVGEKITKPIMDGLKEADFDSKNIYVVKNTNDGFKQVKKLSLNKQSYVLIENDLPDMYNE